MSHELQRPYSGDTSPDAQRLLNRIVREMPERRRAARFFDLNDHVRELAIAGEQQREPGLDRQEAKRRVIRRMLGDAMYDRATSGRTS